MLHIIMTLLIYGVDTEGVRCPDTCTCTETLDSSTDNLSNLTPYEGKNSTGWTLQENLNAYKAILNIPGLDEVKLNAETTAFEENVTSPSLPASSVPGGSGAAKKCSATTKEMVKEIFVNNNNSVGKPSNNSKEIRTKRTLKLNVSESERDGGEADDETENGGRRFPVRRTAEETGKKKKDVFTYQIACTQVRDLKPVWLQYLPNSTTRLSIRRTYFQSFKLFQQILRKTPVKFGRLAVFTVSDNVINQKSSKKYPFKPDPPKNEKNFEGGPMEAGEESFLPFASLQNPKLRTKSEVEEFPFKVKFKNVRVLNLVNNTITFLPRDTFHPFQNLEILNLSNNLIKFIENDTFNPLVNLLRLDLHGNRLISLGENMFKNLTKLLYLDVSQNSIARLAPSTFQYLSSLNILNLAENPLSEKEEAVILLGTGKRLQIVDASRTGLKQIPGTLERSVRVLDLTGNHLLSIRCGDLDGYFLLSYLNLRGNKISYVEDDALGRLELLKILQISDNNMFQVPKSLPNNLEVLNLSYNNIQNLTNFDFLNLSLLKELSVSYNQVSNIESNAFNNLLHLRVLDLSHNPILILPNIYGLAKLTNLNLSYFTNIPGGKNVARYKQFPIQSPESIKQLNLESSPLLTAVFLQDTKTLQLFVQLEKLDVRFSNITTMRKDIFALLPNLRILKVEGNPWHCGKEILILSEWLQAHERENAAADEDEINTAHCSTPSYLYKTTLIALDERHFDALPENNKETNKETNNPMNRNKTVDVARRTQANKNSGDNLENSGSTEKSLENPSNFPSRDDENIAGKEKEVKKVNLKKYSKGVVKVKTLLNQKTKENLQGGKSHFPGKFDGKPEEKPLEKNSTVTWPPSPDKRNWTEFASVVPETWTRDVPPGKGEKLADGGERENNSTIFQGSVPGIPDAKNNSSTSPKSLKTVPLKTVKKAEAVTAKDSLSLEKEYNSHLGFFVLSSIGLIVMAALTFTSIYLSRARRDQSYKRQNQDIEVCSISSIGSELW